MKPFKKESLLICTLVLVMSTSYGSVFDYFELDSLTNKNEKAARVEEVEVDATYVEELNSQFSFDAEVAGVHYSKFSGVEEVESAYITGAFSNHLIEKTEELIFLDTELNVIHSGPASHWINQKLMKEGELLIQQGGKHYYILREFKSGP